MILQNVNLITKKIKLAIVNKAPFSLVRLGDGEFTILRYPKYSDLKKCKARINRWFDASELTMKQIISIRNQILRACRCADVLGVPSAREIVRYSKWKNFKKIAHDLRVFGSNQLYFHFYQIQNIDYNVLLSNLDEVNCITCRNVQEGLQKKFNIKNVNMFYIPAETFLWNNRIKKHNINKGINHYPDRHAQLMESFKRHNLKGRVFLVGAGGLGKSYCNIIKQNGGIAIDIGALFDGWAGLFSRPFLKNASKRYKL